MLICDIINRVNFLIQLEKEDDIQLNGSWPKPNNFRNVRYFVSEAVLQNQTPGCEECQSDCDVGFSHAQCHELS